MTTHRYALPIVAADDEVPEDVHNLTMNALDSLVQMEFRGAQDSPPGTFDEGHTYIVGPTPTGAWSGQANKFAIYIGAAWRFYNRPLGSIGVYLTNGRVYVNRDASGEIGHVIDFTKGVSVGTITDTMGSPPTQANLNACKTAFNNLTTSLRNGGFLGTPGV